jgi:hypothetical protein
MTTLTSVHLTADAVITSHTALSTPYLVVAADGARSSTLNLFLGSGGLSGETAAILDQLDQLAAAVEAMRAPYIAAGIIPAPVDDPTDEPTDEPAAPGADVMTMDDAVAILIDAGVVRPAPALAYPEAAGGPLSERSATWPVYMAEGEARALDGNR